MHSHMPQENLLRRIRIMMILFVVLLVLSGITAFPVYTEMKWLMDQHLFDTSTAIGTWLQRVWEGVKAMNDRYDFLFYGYDWMAFAHIVIGMAFIGPYKDPVRNRWVIHWAMIACLGVIPLAFIAGSIRHIPWFHILIDCSFGIIGIIPLLVINSWITRLEQLQQDTHR